MEHPQDRLHVCASFTASLKITATVAHVRYLGGTVQST